MTKYPCTGIIVFCKKIAILLPIFKKNIFRNYELSFDVKNKIIGFSF